MSVNLSSQNPDELINRLMFLNKRWEKAERLASINALPNTPKVVDELAAISNEASAIWEHLSATSPTHLEGVGFLGM